MVTYLDIIQAPACSHDLWLQWNLQTTDTLGAGVLSTVERLSLSRRFANKPRPSILRSLIGIYYWGAWPAVFLCKTRSERTQHEENRLKEWLNGLSRCRWLTMRRNFDPRFRSLSALGGDFVQLPSFWTISVVRSIEVVRISEVKNTLYIW